MADAKIDDELARTATAPGSPSSGEPAPPLGETLGRYRLERALGEGGMGVVHAALDPDLERRVALKVLRTTGGDEARQRLLREARAMARLTHPNVVAVHEVGTAGGRDYVAMELVEGETLADWLRTGERSHASIVEAFLAAGHGLAAAHAAGLVHRDFKPHNVLRSRDGRVCVTDFGLARGVEVSGLDSTLRMPAMKQLGAAAPSVTATGSLMGTPAYMAPEQWSGGSVGPRADQFAFCVALWEALTGERPFRGETLDELKLSVQRGPNVLDASKLPRRLRAALRRGLDVDPAVRWPNMDALLAAVVRGTRRRRVAVAIAGGAIATSVGLYLLLARSSGGCDAPMFDPGTVWGADRAAALARADQAPAVAAIDGDFAKWQQVRARACQADAAVRPARLACLDGVLAGIEAGARALQAVHGAPHAELGGVLVDPTVCETARPPRLVSTITPERVAALAALLERSVAETPLEPAKAEALIAGAAQDPCAAAVARLVASSTRRTTVERKRDLDEADGDAQRCGDDRLIAQAAYQRALAAVQMHEPDLTPKLERADAAAAAIMQPDLHAQLEEMRATLAQRAGHLDDAITRLESARDGYHARSRVRAELRTELQLCRLREIRGKPDELAQVGKQLAAWHDEAVSKLGASDPVVREIDTAAALWQFANGDVAGAHAKLVAQKRQLPLEHAVHASGRVVDEQGAPVAGATVTAASALDVDAIGVLPDPGQRSTTSRADGTFELPEAAAEGVIVAVLGSRRSEPVKVNDGLTLSLLATSHVVGHIDLRGESPTNVTVVARDPAQATEMFNIVAPVRADGTFSLAGVSRGKMVVHAAVNRVDQTVLTGRPVTIDQDVVRGVELSVPASKRSVDVIVRSTVGLALTRAEVIVMPGHVASTNVADLQHVIQNVTQRSATRIEGEHAPARVLKAAKPGDVYATVTEIPEGAASACAIGMPTEVTDPDLERKIASHLDKIEVRCVPIGEHEEVVLVEVPPWPRFD